MSRPALFRFAVIADTHVNPSDQDLISPFESHRLTNSRLRHTVGVLNALQPEFIVHVGDMIHPVPEAVSYPQAVQQFRQATSAMLAPLYLVPGNHDTGDKLADYVPAGSIRAEYVDLYSRHFGSHFYSFDVQGCHFVVINTSLINSGLAQEQEQRAWLEADLAALTGQRCFLFVHYPPFVADKDEHGHYDNIDQPGRSWLLGLIASYRMAAVFTGHVHNFFFNRHAQTNIYLMPSTAFARADYSEIFQVGQPPENENGRNDTSKLGVMVVDVYDDAIVPQFIRTCDVNPVSAAPGVQRDWPALPPAAGALPTLGIDLRYNWTAQVDIPYSSMLDEFRRKRARNDYPILALWEMGVRHLRVPLDDLLQDEARGRIQAMASSGCRFTVFHFGMPDAHALACISSHRHLLAAFELIAKWPLAADFPERLAQVRAQAGVPLTLSRFWSASGESRDGRQIKLLVDHGFVCMGDDKLSELAAALEPGLVHAAVFRLARSTEVRHGIAAAVASAAEASLQAQIHVRLAADSPAQIEADETSNAHRILEAAFCSHYYRGSAIFLDTLSDVDRGYFPRTGLIDRRCNPRLAGRFLRNLNGALSRLPRLQSLTWESRPQALIGMAKAGSTVIVLVLPGPMTGPVTLPLPCVGRGRWIELVDGVEHDMAPMQAEDQRVLFDGGTGFPALLVFQADG